MTKLSEFLTKAINSPAETVPSVPQFHMSEETKRRQDAVNKLLASEKMHLSLARNKYVTRHEPTKDMLRRAELIANRSEPVLITGPTGTGKELVAELIASTCRARAISEGTSFPPITTVNCAGFVDTLFESLVFGHRKGAFTGANADNPGLLVKAGKGIVFFDEIGELPMPQQAKLLRAIQYGRILPVGANEEVPIHCRFIFATHRELERATNFREDLYYRISVFELRTFGLVDRPGDADLIAQRIIAENNYTPLDEGDFPLPPWTYERGNVRQLQRVLLRREAWGLDLNEVKDTLNYEH